MQQPSDTEMLDWLTRNETDLICYTDGLWTLVSSNFDYLVATERYANPRAAIMAAMEIGQ